MEVQIWSTNCYMVQRKWKLTFLEPVHPNKIYLLLIFFPWFLKVILQYNIWSITILLYALASYEDKKEKGKGSEWLT